MSQLPKWHLDQFTLFLSAHPYAPLTDTQTTLHAMSVAVGHTLCSAGDAA